MCLYAVMFVKVNDTTKPEQQKSAFNPIAGAERTNVYGHTTHTLHGYVRIFAPRILTPVHMDLVRNQNSNNTFDQSTLLFNFQSAQVLQSTGNLVLKGQQLLQLLRFFFKLIFKHLSSQFFTNLLLNFQHSNLSSHTCMYNLYSYLLSLLNKL